MPEMDMVLLCVLIAFERNKEDQSRLFNQAESVQKDLVVRSLGMIDEPEFRSEEADLFLRRFEMVEATLHI